MQNHLSVIAEGVPAFGWVTVVRRSRTFVLCSFVVDLAQEPKPGPYVKDMKESAEFYANRVVKEFKERCPRPRSLTLPRGADIAQQSKAR